MNGPVMLAAVCLPALAAAESPEARFADAQRAFETARQRAETHPDDVETRQAFFTAARAFAALAEDGVRSRNLYINAGNAYHFAGNPERALLWYLRANRLRSTSQTRGAIARLRRVCGVALWPESRGSVGRALMFWHYDVRSTTKQRIFLLLFPLGCVLLGVPMFVARGRRGLFRVGWVLVLAGATMGVSDLVMTTFPPPGRAVVVDMTPGRSGDGTSYSIVVDDMVAGQEVEIIEARGAWTEVALPSGVSCWFPTRALEEIT
jgi:hypothetical protein